MTSKTVSPTPKNRSAMERMVGSLIDVESGLMMDSTNRQINLVMRHVVACTHLNPLDRRTPARTVDSMTASNA